MDVIVLNIASVAMINFLLATPMEIGEEFSSALTDPVIRETHNLTSVMILDRSPLIELDFLSLEALIHLLKQTINAETVEIKQQLLPNFFFMFEKYFEAVP